MFITGRLGDRGRFQVFPLREASGRINVAGKETKCPYCGFTYVSKFKKCPCCFDNPKAKCVAQRGREDGQQLEIQEGDHTNSLTGVQKDNMIAMRWSRTDKGKEARRNSKKNTGVDYTPFNEGHRELQPTKGGISGCITGVLNKDALLGNYASIRRLTPTECERLQGFPDDWTKYGIDEHGKKVKISDSQRYKCIGNAVTTNVITAIMEQLICATHGRRNV